MSIFKIVPAVIVLAAVSMGGIVAAHAQQPAKRIVVAMAPADDAAAPEARRPMRAPAHAMHAPRAKHFAMAAPKSKAEDCFWCNRPVYISGLTY